MGCRNVHPMTIQHWGKTEGDPGAHTCVLPRTGHTWRDTSNSLVSWCQSGLRVLACTCSSCYLLFPEELRDANLLAFHSSFHSSRDNYSSTDNENNFSCYQPWRVRVYAVKCAANIANDFPPYMRDILVSFHWLLKITYKQIMDCSKTKVCSSNHSIFSSN